MQKKIVIHFETIENQALSPAEKQLKLEAEQALQKAYAPYSNFKVGCSILLENGAIVSGANQEVAAYPVCICAEGSALSTASSMHPNVPVKAIFIVAQNTQGMVLGAAPCGVCRQRMVEYEQRFNNSIAVYLPETTHTTLKIESAKDLLPLTFTAEKL
jgi:cytidine deaminase